MVNGADRSRAGLRPPDLELHVVVVDLARVEVILRGMVIDESEPNEEVQTAIADARQRLKPGSK